MSPEAAWSCTFAFAVSTVSEARAAVTKLDELGIHGTPQRVGGAISRTLALAGREELSRPLLRRLTVPCTLMFTNTLNWAHAHLYLGEFDDQHGATTSACAHYAKVLERWGQAKPRSVTADEARAHSTKLGCAP